MRIPMVDLQTQTQLIRTELDQAIGEVLASCHFINGPAVAAFEQELAAALASPYALAAANGTDALQIALMALGVGPGDEVITPSFTFVATAEAAAVLGAHPVFCDIDPGSFNLDPAKLAPLITERTKAIVPVHLFGQPADMDPILALARERNIPVVEDNAQAIGATYKGRTTGTLGDVGTLSFFPSKNLGAFGDGGAITTASAELERRMRMIASHGSARRYHNERIGLNSRLDAVQAAVLRVKLRYLDGYNLARRAAADTYDRLFADVPQLVVPPRSSDSVHVFHQYTLRVVGGVDRDGLAAHLSGMGIANAIYYPVPLHQLEAYACEADGQPGSGEARARRGPLPETERAAAEVISLPMHSELSEPIQQEIADAVLAFVSGGVATA